MYRYNSETMSFNPVGSVRRFLNKLKNSNGNFYSCIKWTLLSYRSLFVFPFVLKENRSGNNFSFKWSSPYMIFINIPFVIIQAMTTCIYGFDTVSRGFTFRVLSLTITYTSGLMTSLLITNLGKNFKQMYKKIMSVERKLPPIIDNSRVVHCLPVILVVGCGLSIFGCVLNIMYLYHMATHCSPQDDQSLLKTYFDVIFASIFRYIYFSYTASFIFQAVKIQIVVLGTLNSILMISCSAYLENRFNNLNNIISAEQENVSMDWPKIREHYVQLTKLVKIIDKRINPIVFLTYLFDLYNLCLQCYYVVRQSYYYLLNFDDCIQGQSDLLQTRFYKPFEALFTLTKMAAVSLLCARLYTASRRPLSCLHTVPQTAYNHEAHRFMEQVYHSKIALSGFEFFYITKEIMITVLGILVTYELVLIQL